MPILTPRGIWQTVSVFAQQYHAKKMDFDILTSAQSFQPSGLNFLRNYEYFSSSRVVETRIAHRFQSSRREECVLQLARA
jgi:hypothetical protein